MDKEDALRFYQRLDNVEQLLAAIKAMLEAQERECGKQQSMVDELRKRVNALEQAQAKNMGGLSTALAMLTAALSVSTLLATIYK